MKPYLGIKNGGLEDRSANEGVNFAVIGATALDVSFFEERGIHNVETNYSLTVQLNWFKELLPALCNHSSSSKFSIILSLIIYAHYTPTFPKMLLFYNCLVVVTINYFLVDT